jgi:hypothetical protein
MFSDHTFPCREDNHVSLMSLTTSSLATLFWGDRRVTMAEPVGSLLVLLPPPFFLWRAIELTRSFCCHLDACVVGCGRCLGGVARE